MSQMTSTARVSPRALNRPNTRTPGLRVVTGAPPRRGGAAFGILCATLLATGLIGLLMLNTALAQDSFTLQELQASSDQLTDSEDALNQSLAALKSPANLASRAAAMGMVPAQSVAFLRLSDGRVIGVAEPAKRGPAFNVVRTTSTPPIKPRAKGAKSASPSAAAQAKRSKPSSPPARTAESAAESTTR